MISGPPLDTIIAQFLPTTPFTKPFVFSILHSLQSGTSSQNVTPRALSPLSNSNCSVNDSRE